MNIYKVRMPKEGHQRILADGFQIIDGSLVFYIKVMDAYEDDVEISTESRIAFAPGTWRLVYLDETTDERRQRENEFVSMRDALTGKEVQNSST